MKLISDETYKQDPVGLPFQVYDILIKYGGFSARPYTIEEFWYGQRINKEHVTLDSPVQSEVGTEVLPGALDESTEDSAVDNEQESLECDIEPPSIDRAEDVASKQALPEINFIKVQTT